MSLHYPNVSVPVAVNSLWPLVVPASALSLQQTPSISHLAAAVTVSLSLKESMFNLFLVQKSLVN